MRTIAFVLLLGRLMAADFTVHEWGTFTSVSGSDGELLSGLELEEDRLPPFVLSHAGFAPFNKGWDRPVVGVTIKMETPVLYFYSDAREAFAVRAAVGFRGGSISQWYPDRTSGENLPPVPKPAERASTAPIDFRAGYAGSAVWHVDVLPRSSSLTITAPRTLETPQWPRARVPDANRVRGPKGQVEGFIFYRGIGNFSLPLQVQARPGGEVLLRNNGTDPITAFVYEKRANASDRRWFATEPLAPGQSRAMAAAAENATSIEEPLRGALITAGLTRDEAGALLSTWRESYFERPGLRVFWIVPRTFTDAVLPLSITPQPAKLERVLVGRTEVLTPEFETRLMREFASNGGRQWENDRYFRAYRERVRRLGGIAGAPVVSTP